MNPYSRPVRVPMARRRLGERVCPTCARLYANLGAHRCAIPPPPPHCRCGCGELVEHVENGVWSQWRPGHAMRRGSAQAS